ATKVTSKAKSVKASKKPKVTVTVKATGVAKPTGTVTVKYGKKSVKVKLKARAKGKVSVTLPKLKKGSYANKDSFTPDKSTGKLAKKASAKKITLPVKSTPEGRPRRARSRPALHHSKEGS